MRSRERQRSRSGSRQRHRNGSLARDRNESHSRSKVRKRSRSQERPRRSRSRDRGSGSRDKVKRRSRSRERSVSRDKVRRSQSRDRERKRSESGSSEEESDESGSPERSDSSPAESEESRSPSRERREKRRVEESREQRKREDSHLRERRERRSHSRERRGKSSHSMERNERERRDRRSHSRERREKRSPVREKRERRSPLPERRERRERKSPSRERRERTHSGERKERRTHLERKHQSPSRDRETTHSREHRRRGGDGSHSRGWPHSHSPEEPRRHQGGRGRSLLGERGKKHRETKKKEKKKKKHKKKYSSSSSSLSESDDEAGGEMSFMERLQEERARALEDKLALKKQRKLLETPAEKRLRRLQKKEAKERKRKEKMGWDSEYLHFTNADNPYGDNNLLDTFVWKKKLEKEGLTDLTREDIEKRSRAKMDENRMELEKVKKRRQERELERQEREKMMELEQRQREAAQFSQFSRQEDQFQLEQARLRSQIRIQDGRAKPIDLLAQYVSSEGDVSAVDMHEPYTHLTGLTLVDLEDLLEDIRVYMQLEKEDINQSYWNDLITIVQDELRRLRQRDVASIDLSAHHRQGIHAAVASDVSSVFVNKSVAELNQLQRNIEMKLAGPTTGLDIGYWESLLSQLRAHQARARLRERHRDNLRKKLEMLKAEQGVKEEDEEEEEEEDEEQEQEQEEPRRMERVEERPVVMVKEEVEEERRQEKRRQEAIEEDKRRSSSEEEEEIKKEPQDEEEEKKEKEEEEGEEEQEGEEWDSECEGDSAIQASLALYVSGRYSPRLVAPNRLEPGTVVVDEAEDTQRLAWARQRVVGAGQAVESVLTAEEKVMQREAQRAMTSEEAQFSVEARLDPQHFLWSDKYRPRKPRYFNRVHTGFEWNKYNQTHYDMDNPPPKIVQGYKFNIFYPDLIDKSKTPQYELIPCSDNRDFALLKFTAGPPYEAIAFKIVNREWEYSYKRGFRCQFHNNIFQLWFHFKRYRYRR